MDLSINNNGINSKKISFEGFKYDYNAKNLPVFEFAAPPHQEEQDVILQLRPYLSSSESKKITELDLSDSEALKKAGITLKTENGITTCQLNEKQTKNILNKYDGLLYRFIINGKPVLDSYEKIQSSGGEEFNVIKTSKNFGITPKAGAMRHSFVDSDVSPSYLEYLKTSAAVSPNITVSNAGSDFVHNHFNKLGGSIRGIDYLLTKTDELEPYNYIISTPDIGADPVSSHKYWPNNLYQCSDIQAFKDLNFHAFERGKGYVADGAFTSQSLQSPLVQHVYKWGEKSPWYKLLKINGYIEAGILPYDKEAYNHTGVKIVNSPYYDKKNYKKNKPTYIQFFDDRLVSNKLRNSNELIEKTDTMPDDHYDITSNDDSVYMYYFEISPNDKRHTDVFRKAKKNNLLLKDMENVDDFLTFENFKIKTKPGFNGYTAWDGNIDLVKMNLSNSGDMKAMKQARQYILGAATYWTEAIQADLILRCAKASSRERRDITSDKNEISLKKIAENNNVNLDEVKNNLDSASFPVLEQKKGIDEYVEEFPLQSIETSPELSAIFAQPDFNEKLLSNKVSLIASMVDNAIENAIPDKYKDSEEYKQYVIKTYAPEIIKTLYAGALDNKVILEDGTLDYDRLKNVTLRSIQSEQNYEPNTPEEEQQQVINKIGKIGKGLSEKNIKPIEKRIKKELEDISLDDFKTAESVVIQGKGGLNWRFDAAKDIGDLDAIRKGRKTFAQIWPEVESFWTDFVGNVRKYNPSSYVINEITDLWSFYNTCKTAEEKREKFDLELDPDKKEREFFIKTGSTTSSNYGSYFNKLACFVGVNAENFDTGDNHPIKRAGNIDMLSDCVKNFMTSNQPNNVDFSHTFVENHDKPRILHVLPLDIELFHSPVIKGNEKYEKLAKELTDCSEKDYDKISPRALAVAEVMNKQIKSSNDFSEIEKQKLSNALKQLTLGKKTDNPNEKVNFKRSEAFGVMPYEVSIRDLFKRAGIKEDEDKVLNFHASMLSKAMKQQISMWEMMNAIPGIPTLFNGAEFAQTGFESLNKNVYQTNRNAVLHYLKDDKRYKPYYEKMQAISGLYKLDNGKLSAIRDGSKTVLETVQSDEKPLPKMKDGSLYDSGEYKYIIGQIANSDAYAQEGYKAVEEFYNDKSKSKEKLEKKFAIASNEEKNFNNFIKCYEDGSLEDAIEAYEDNQSILKMLPIFSYNDKGSQVLQLITNQNVPKSCLAYKAKADEQPRKLDFIKLENCPFEDGTVLKRKVYKSGTSYSSETVENAQNSNKADRKYIVKDGTIYPVDGAKIEVDDTVLTFYKSK